MTFTLFYTNNLVLGVHITRHKVFLMEMVKIKKKKFKSFRLLILSLCATLRRVQERINFLSLKLAYTFNYVVNSQ
jgi:hypothetical protein